MHHVDAEQIDFAEIFNRRLDRRGAQGSSATHRAGRGHAARGLLADAQQNLTVTLAPVLGETVANPLGPLGKNSQSRSVVCAGHGPIGVPVRSPVSLRLSSHRGTRRKRGPHAVGLGLAVQG